MVWEDGKEKREKVGQGNIKVERGKGRKGTDGGGSEGRSGWREVGEGEVKGGGWKGKENVSESGGGYVAIRVRGTDRPRAGWRLSI